MGDDAREGVQPPPADSVDADHNQGIVTGVYAPTTIAHADSDDRAVLVALFNATDGENWVNKDNWMSDEPLGQWYGVTADGNGRVTELTLRDNGLSGELPEGLGNLANLQVLRFGGDFRCGTNGCRPKSPSGNRLTGTIPPELGNLANLKSLDLAANQLTGEIPPELGSLANLESLGLSANQLTGEIPAWLGGLASLKFISLNGNQLSGPIPPELGNLSNLKGLGLFRNELTGEIPPELGSLTNLERLYLSNNQLTGPIPPELGSLAKLVQLWLRDNQLTGEIPAELGSLTNLKDLTLSGNQLTGTIPPELGSLTNLEKLYLHNNQLTGTIPPAFGSLSKLVQLWLRNNQLTGTIPPALGSLTNLERLYLSGNQLTGCVPQDLGGVPHNDFSRLRLPFCDMPGAPTIATLISTGETSLTVTWTVPINPGTSDITAYDLRYIDNGATDKSDANWTVMEDVWTTGTDSLEHTLTGLTDGTQYDLQVRAVNSGGDGAWSITGTTASAGDPLVNRYDADGDNMIDKAEVINAINDYLFGEGAEAISKADVIELINLYLFG